ncbi:1-acyl-sn-glycerol-3-phosphate acyltransferase [Prevotella sp. KH2C16]|uniref:1-acyl-sn-glycerol-3-phosphate acyltransferase n=1 Tax=Prevotella sp. KH2C16 TaxID=1855325 RepID=UPI0008EE7E2A|nr:1-acyl-sn-glycerol-3-phosphate acyltransferase [Prevotella sp. KH2C16]SFF92297.1 1-acyl-sn-glycerol-3-phosphate acyltransferases [Prevotella sp. KH2C16]
MTKFFLSIYDFLNTHKVASGVFLILLFTVFIVLASGVHYEEDIAKFLPQNEQNEKYQAIYEHTSSQNRIAVLFMPRAKGTAANEDSLEMAMEFVGQELSGKREVRNLQVKIDDENIANLVEFVYQNIPYFLKKEDYRRIDSLLRQPDYVKTRMRQNRDLLLMPMGSVMTQTLKYDPLHLYTPVMRRLQGFNLSDGFQLVDGYIFTKDGQHAMLTFDSPYGSSETRQNEKLATMLDSVIVKAEKAYPTLRISAVGAPLIAVTNAHQIKSDALIAVSIAAVLILLLLVVHYRRLSDILWISVSLAFGWLFALAGMSLFHESVSMIVLGIGSVIIGIAVNYPLHFLDHIREVHDRREALQEMVPPLLIGNITTVAAFLCLIWLDAQAMRDLGWFGALMLMGTILFVLIFLPLYAKNGKPLRKAVKREAGDGLLQGRKPLFTILLAVITLVLGYFSLHTSFDSDLQHINYMTEGQREDMKLLMSSVKQSPVYVVTEGRNLEEALRKNRATMGRLSVSNPNDTVVGIGGFMPYREQTETLAEWGRFTDSKSDSLLTAFKTACRTHGFAVGAFRPFTNQLQTMFSPKPVSYFEPVFGLLGSSFIIKDKTGVKIVDYVYGSGEDSIKKSVDLAFSSKDIGNQLVKVLNDSFNYVGFVCGFVVFFFLWISFRKIELSLMSFLPLAVSWIWILGLMQLLGIQFNIVNIILATFIFGQGDDYTIFITEGLVYEHTTGKKRLASYKRSVVFSAVLMFIGIGCLIFARHPALRSLGAVTVIGMATVVFMAYYLPPLVFRWMTRAGRKNDCTRHETFITRPLPYTLKRLAYSTWTLLMFLVFMFLFALPYTWLHFHIGKNTEKKHERYHKVIQKTMKFMMRVIPGVKFKVDNSVGETFEKPAIVICNHQSHFDILSLLQFTPKMIIMTNNWTWNNPFYGSVLHHGDFLPVDAGLEANMPRLKELYGKGYSIVIYPEATRSEDCSIGRFHKGAFYLAHELKADILPMYIHGHGYALPKKDFMLREGEAYIEVGRRVRLGNYDETDPESNEAILKFTHKMRHHYQEHYAELRKRIETPEYLGRFYRLRDYYKMKGL